MDASSSSRGRYGIDRPVIVGLFAVLLVVAIGFATAGLASDEPATSLGPIIAMAFFGVGLLLVVRSGKVGKPHLWNELLDQLDLRGDEQVLDVGCGRGLVLIKAAKQLTTGTATGIDIWKAKDQSGNSKKACDRNVLAEGVADRVEVLTADATSMPFDDAEFDVIIASLSLGAMPLARDREKATAEMVRVLRPGGRIVILDVRATEKMADLLETAKLTDVDRSKSYWSMYPPARVVTAYKKGGHSRSRANRNRDKKNPS